MTRTDQADWLAERTFRSPSFVVQLLLLIMVVVGIAALVEIEREQMKAEADRQKIEQIAKHIESCVEPTGDCARRGERTASTAVRAINQISIYAAYCASVHQGPTPVKIRDVEMCVQRQLQRTRL